MVLESSLVKVFVSLQLLEELGTGVLQQYKPDSAVSPEQRVPLSRVSVRAPLRLLPSALHRAAGTETDKSIAGKQKGTRYPVAL